MPTVEGVLHLYSETGTEGGYWALQDKEHIHKHAVEYGVWAGMEVWDKESPDRHGVVAKEAELSVLKDGKWYPLPDPIQEDPDYYESSLFKGASGDREADKRLMEKFDFKIKYDEDLWNEKWGEGNWYYEDDDAVAPDGTRYLGGGTPMTEPHRPYGVSTGQVVKASLIRWDDGTEESRLSDSLLVKRWEYEGLNVLKDGDYLTIYDKDDPEKVIWEGEIKLKRHSLFTEDAFGFWIHADQKGIDRETWAKWFFAEHPATLRRK